MNNNLPRRITVKSVISSRYEPGERPSNWGEREEGIEVITTEDSENKGSETLSIFSNGGQSSPAPGWEILLNKAIDDAFTWTLYALKPTTKDTSGQNK